MAEDVTRLKLLLLVLGTACLPALSVAGEYRIQSRADWERWTLPQGAVELRNDGSVGLRRLRRDIDAVANAGEFEHATKSSGVVSGGVRRAGSGLQTGALAIDGDPGTWWRPSMDDAQDDWWLEVDLGRLVLGTRLRLVFADENGARPFRRFAVYISDGRRVTPRADLFQFTRVAATIHPNEDSVVDVDLRTIEPGDATGDFLVTRDTLDFAPVHYVRFVAESRDEGAGLAEIEVWTPGDNLALGAVRRGGTITAGDDEENAGNLADGDIDSFWSESAVNEQAGDYVAMGAWYEWDLGATFWLDRVVSLENRIYGTYFATSDGTALRGAPGDGIADGFDYQQLSQISNITTLPNTVFDLQFPRRRVRSIFYHMVPYFWEDGTPADVYIKVYEHMLFGEGYPAAAELTSEFLDLGGEKSITRLSWTAHTPPGTAVEIRSRTGDHFEVDTYYYTKAGREITKAMWDKLPKSQKIPPVEIVRPAADWSDWSPVYLAAGEAFRSPSPRKHVQLRARLLSEDPEAAASLRSIVLSFDDPLLQKGVTGRILPREAAFDSLQEFAYTIRPVPAFGDAGFDQVLIQVPSPVELVGLRLAGQDVEATSAMAGDSLVVDLPRVVRRDSVEVRFLGRLTETTTEFSAWLRNLSTGVGQGIRPTTPKATTVYVPAVAAGGLIRNVQLAPSLITPNGDGRNDRVTVRPAVAKVHSDPEVAVYTLAGAHVRRLRDTGEGFVWDGRDEADRLAPPGTYICRISVSADAGDETVHRTIRVAY